MAKKNNKSWYRCWKCGFCGKYAAETPVHCRFCGSQMTEGEPVVNQPRDSKGRFISTKKETTTNADKIREMSDEELASYLCWTSCVYCKAFDFCQKGKIDRGCKNIILDWLKQEAKE